MTPRASGILGGPRDWMDRAACYGDDTELFFDERSTDAAITACLMCPVRDPCLAWVMGIEGDRSAEWRAGVYGGLTSKERAALAGNGTVLGRPTGWPLADCGTDSAYNRHVRRGEPIDDACRAAHREAGRRRTATGTSAAPW